jgi:VWFA-related protein
MNGTIQRFAMFTCFAGVAFLQAAPAQAPQQKPPAANQPPTSAPAIQTQTRLITVDVVVTDSHGKPVRGLTQDDFQILEEHAGPQKIAKFRFVDASANAPTTASASQPPGAHVYSNQAFDKLTMPPSILLMDALNTDIQQQSEVHRHMLMLLKTLPTTTPVAVFVLGHTLHVVQNFTTDPALLRAAVDKTLRTPDIEQNPQDDANSPSNVALDLNGDQETQATQALEDFEKTEFEAQMAIRVDETTDAMVAIAKYLGGYPGRKNLLWFSEAFPNWIAPTADFGANPFEGSATYSDKIRKAFESLTDAQVAVYPVDARGLETSQLYSTAQNPHINRNNPGAGFGSQLNRDNNTRLDAQATMEEIASETGGKLCVNTNDLSGCVQSALDDSSVYYELAYYPENVKWDGGFHKIAVKSNQRGAKLRYRTGYFATDPSTLAKQQTPDKLLQEACMGPLPSTSIPLSAMAIQPQQAQGQAQAPPARYLLTISPSALTLPSAGGTRQLSLQMAICEYNPEGDKFDFYPRDFSRPVPEAVYQGWQAHGIRNIFDYAAKPENQRLRFAVLDVPSGTTGSLDVPAHPHDFGSLPGGVAPPQGTAQPSGAALGPSELSQALAPMPGAPPPAQQITTALTFRSSSGQVSKLDWGAGKVTYQGDLGVELGASGFFQKFLGAQYHCQAGNLVPNNPSSTTTPRLAFVLRGVTGSALIVDVTGTEPQYTGDLPVDPDAKLFFNQVWKVCHCQAP